MDHSFPYFNSFMHFVGCIDISNLKVIPLKPLKPIATHACLLTNVFCNGRSNQSTYTSLSCTWNEFILGFHIHDFRKEVFMKHCPHFISFPPSLTCVLEKLIQQYLVGSLQDIYVKTWLQVSHSNPAHSKIKKM